MDTNIGQIVIKEKMNLKDNKILASIWQYNESQTDI